MTIYFHDHIGAVAVMVNDSGITFDRDKTLAIFEDEGGKEYKLSTFDIELITNE